MSIQVNKVTNASIYIDGIGYIGQASSVDVPTLNQAMTEHSGLGMIGKFDLPTGVEKLEGSITWNAVYAAAMRVTADPNTTHQLQIRYSIESHTTQGRVAQVPGIVIMNARFKSLPGGTFNQHENVELESAFEATSFKLQLDGETIIDYDVFSNTYKVNGVDVAAEFRANIGQV